MKLFSCGGLQEAPLTSDCPACSLQRDPRFEEACGKLDATAFDKRYGFVYDELIPAETEQLKGKLKVHPGSQLFCVALAHCKSGSACQLHCVAPAHCKS